MSWQFISVRNLQPKPSMGLLVGTFVNNPTVLGGLNISHNIKAMLAIIQIA